MYIEKEILGNQESLDAVIRGINLASDKVTPTLGPKGGNVIFKDRWGNIHISNDGFKILMEMWSPNETEQMAIEALQKEAIKTNMKAGDASTTFVTLNQAILKEGVASKKHYIAKKEEIMRDCNVVLGVLEGTAKPVKSFEEIKQIATVAVKNEEIGHKIAEAYLKVGKEGQIIVKESDVNGIDLEYTNGFDLDVGYASPMMMNNERGEAVLHNPYILIVNSYLANYPDLYPILDKLAKKDISELIIVCEGVEGNMLPVIAANKRAKYVDKKRVMEVFVVALGEDTNISLFEDISTVINGQIIGKSAGVLLENVSIEDLGRCEKAVITDKKSTFIGALGDVESKIESLRNQIDETNKDEINSRIARLKGEVAVIKIGAASGADLGYIKDKIEDSIYATKGAMEEGAVRGGGVALKMIAQDLPEGILKNALQYPYNQIQENTGGNFKIEDDVFDSVKSTRIVVENACSFAATLLTVTGSCAPVRQKPNGNTN